MTEMTRDQMIPLFLPLSLLRVHRACASSETCQSDFGVDFFSKAVKQAGRSNQAE